MKKEQSISVKELYIGIGSNLHDPKKQVNAAIQKLLEQDEFNDLKVSKFYESEPMGPQDQGNYVNCVVRLKSGATPEDILLLFKGIESMMGREKSPVKWSERIIDLDIILYGDLVYQSETLTIPHKDVADRAFVLQPLIDIDPEIFIPQKGYARDLIKSCLYKNIKKIEK